MDILFSVRTRSMWSAPVACMACILFVMIICDVEQVLSQPILIQRETDRTPDDVTKLEEDIHRVINQIHSLSSENENTRSFGINFTKEAADVGLDEYFRVLGNLYDVAQPLLRDRFTNDLPKNLVCILSGRQDCGLKAELTKTVSLGLGKPLLMYMSSLRSQTCASPVESSDGKSSGFLRFLGMGGSTTAAFSRIQQIFLNMLSSLPLSGNMMTAVTGVVDYGVKYMLNFVAPFLQEPMDYIKIALQFGIRVPSLDGKETCEQGDLKQLIMWGIKNDVTWSFGSSLIDILLEIFLASEQCTYPGGDCQNPLGGHFKHSDQEAGTDNIHPVLLNCDRHNLARLNDTLCDEILTSSSSKEGSSPSLLTFCQALSFLSPRQMEQTWSNVCYIIQALVYPLVSKSSDCSMPAVDLPLHGLSLPHPAPQRNPRAAPNLGELACNYNSWREDRSFNDFLVTFCSEDQPEVFQEQVCQNVSMMKMLLVDPRTNWLYKYCANSTVDPSYMVSHFCVYDEWLDLKVTVKPSLLEFCLVLDGPRLKNLICGDNKFFMILSHYPDNYKLLPNCSNLLFPAPDPGLDSSVLDSCRYSEWNNVSQITTDVLSKCAIHDSKGFIREVCSNQTFLNSLLRKEEHSWLASHCRTSQALPPTHVQFACDYNSWLKDKLIDVQLVAFCSKNQPEVFEKQVCQNALLMKALLVDQRTHWLYKYCANSSADPSYMVSHFCVYDEWLDLKVTVKPSLLEFCLVLDGPRLKNLICGDNKFFMILSHYPDNYKLLPNCSNLAFTAPDPGLNSLMLDSCRYSEWNNVSQITTDVLSKCAIHDPKGFNREVCSNQTFLNSLLRKEENSWLVSHCRTSQALPPTHVQFACDYNSWLEDKLIDVQLVAFCSKDQPEVFKKQVCQNALLMKALLVDPKTYWLYKYCANSSVDPSYMVSHFCVYDEWLDLKVTVKPSLLEFCLVLDGPRLTNLICGDNKFFMILSHYPDIYKLLPNCSNLAFPASDPGLDLLMLDSCHYSEWNNVNEITTNVLTKCVIHDPKGFNREVCSNQTFLNALLRKEENSWLASHCRTSQTFQSPPVQFACDYNSWLEDKLIDVQLVTYCSKDQREVFEKQVCQNASLMKTLLLNLRNNWLYKYCANSSADPSYMVSHFCIYDEWLDLKVNVKTSLLEFCLVLDGPRLMNLICSNNKFFMILSHYPDNYKLMPNCSNLPFPAPDPGLNSLMLDSCRYSEWNNVSQITTDVLSKCVIRDPKGFIREVCSNQTFLNALLRKEENSWLASHCRTSQTLPPTKVTAVKPLTIADWCDYHTWGERKVDDSVVGLCWQQDQLAFQKNVCCEASLLEKLLRNPQNKWVKSVCADMKEIEETPQVCKYAEWTRPIIVDMTELALCAEIDPVNFTSKVCSNGTVLQNLLANQDNTWLLKHCANYTKPSPGGGGGQGGGVTGFNPAEQCQYSSWRVSLPDSVLLTLCFQNDQTKFVTSICPNSGLLFLLASEPSSKWVSSMCSTYTNYTSTTTTATTTTTTTTTTAKPKICLAKKLVREFNWTCSPDFTSACQPGASQNMVLQMIVHCWVESLRSRVENLMTPPVANMMEQAVSITVVVLLALEEVQNTSLHVTENLRLSVLSSVARYLERENNTDKKQVLLQCFGSVLTSLMQTARDAMTQDAFFIIKEYFKISPSSLASVLRTSYTPTIRLILQYYNRNKDTLRLSDKHLSTMLSVLFQNHLVKDGSLSTDLAPLLARASVTDIHALPSVQKNTNVRETINRYLWNMSLDQRRAFGSWYAKELPISNIINGHQTLIRDTGNLIAYLPFHNFQHFSPAQIYDGLEVLQKNTLNPLKQEFIVQNIIGTYRNLTAQDFTRLGYLSCLADPNDLLAYKGTEAFSVIQEFIMNCTREGRSLSSHMTSSVLLNSTELNVPSLLSPDRLAELAPLLPSLGVTFLQDLTPSQLSSILLALDSVPFSPAQVSLIVEKLHSSPKQLGIPGRLKELGSLVVGVKTEALLSVTSDKLLSTLPDMAQHTPGLNPPQANAISAKLWGFPDVVEWLDDVEPLLYSTPLLSILPRIPYLVNINASFTKPWNTQQAKAIFNRLLATRPNHVKQNFLSLGTVGQGVSCKVIQEIFMADPLPDSVRRILAFLRQQPGPLNTPLKRCVIEALYKFEFFPDLLESLGAEIALSIAVSTIKKFSTESIDVLRRIIIQDPHEFMLLSRRKQTLLVDKIMQKMQHMYIGVFTEDEFRSLGVMATFVADEVFVQVDRSFFTDSLDFLLGQCYTSSKMEIVARILQEPDTFGPVEGWNQTTLSQVARFLYFLPRKTLEKIPLELMTVTRIEKLMMSQRQWERGDVGTHCLDEDERKESFEKQQHVLQFFLGFLKINPQSPTPMVPSCEILHTTAPSAWTSSSLTRMSSSAFSNCLELMAQDPFLASYQRNEVIKRVKEMYGPVSSFSQSLVSQLGGLAVGLSLQELNSLRLTERRSIFSVGAVDAWNSRQLAALFATVLNSTRQSPSQLDSSTFVAMGYIVCGATAVQMKGFNAVEFSKAVLWLGQLRLSCSEEQLLKLVGLLSNSLAFGPINTWGTDVFIEIGILAAGLPDIAMSSLVKEQIEGITPLAISMIPPEKLAVVFHQSQIGMFSYEQAAAITKEQLSALSSVQQNAVDMVLTPWEDRPLNLKGRSLGLALRHSPLCLILGLLMLLIIPCCTDLICPGT